MMIKKYKAGLRFEIKFYERLLAKHPDFTDALVPLAELYTKVGQYRKGLLLDRRLSRLKPEDAIVYYNMACSYALLGNNARGFAALERAVELGYDDFVYMDSDPDLQGLRKDSRYRVLIGSVVRRKKELKHGMDAGAR